MPVFSAWLLAGSLRVPKMTGTVVTDLILAYDLTDFHGPADVSVGAKKSKMKRDSA